MNTAAATLLRSLDSLGVQSIRFRVTSLGNNLRHTVPLAHSVDEAKEKRFSDLSVPGLFSAYSLIPRRGEYLLDVNDGTLAFTPVLPHPTVPARLSLLKKRRPRSKNRRHTDHSHKLAA